MSFSRIRVLQIGKYYPPYHGGMETHLHALCTAMREDVDLQVVVANDSRRTVREVVDGVRVTRLGALATVASTPLTPGLSREISRSGADIVHLHFPHPTGIVAWLLSRHPGRLVVTYHSDIVRQRALGAMFTPILHRALEQAAAIVCTSPQYVASSPVLQRHADRCLVLPFGVPTERLAHPDVAEVAALRARYGPRIVLGVGRMVSYKGYEYLVRAMRDVDARLLIIGDGPERAALERQIAREGVADRVELLGSVRDMTPFLHAADVFALASVQRSEAFGIVQVEAMACARPVVNTALDSGVPYVSIDGETGITVPPRDAPALAGAIRRLLDDPALRVRLGSAGRARAERLFSVESMRAATLALYERLVHGRGGARVAPLSSVA